MPLARDEQVSQCRPIIARIRSSARRGFMLPRNGNCFLVVMLIKIKILRQEINLNRDYSHSATSSDVGKHILSCHLNKSRSSRKKLLTFNGMQFYSAILRVDTRRVPFDCRAPSGER